MLGSRARSRFVFFASFRGAVAESDGALAEGEGVESARILSEVAALYRLAAVRLGLLDRQSTLPPHDVGEGLQGIGRSVHVRPVLDVLLEPRGDDQDLFFFCRVVGADDPTSGGACWSGWLGRRAPRKRAGRRGAADPRQAAGMPTFR